MKGKVWQGVPWLKKLLVNVLNDSNIHKISRRDFLRVIHEKQSFKWVVESLITDLSTKTVGKSVETLAAYRITLGSQWKTLKINREIPESFSG
jgi:hypothetical protein